MYQRRSFIFPAGPDHCTVPGQDADSARKAYSAHNARPPNCSSADRMQAASGLQLSAYGGQRPLQASPEPLKISEPAVRDIPAEANHPA